jgi:hypothetical protein
MMGFRPRASRFKNEKGQAMPLAAVGLFVMALGVLATLNLGQAVYQKIQLQNTADSAAYSLAAMEARTFNYIAFLNRVQIAHYNSAMVVQSYMTWVGFQVAINGTAIDLLKSVANGCEMGENLPYVGYLYKAGHKICDALAEIFGIMREAAFALLKVMEYFGHNFVDAMTVFNKDVIWQSQLARAVLLNGHLTTAMMSYVHKNDPDIQFGSGGAGGAFNLGLNAALNSIEYYQTFSSGSGVNPQWVKLITDYKRIMKGGEYTDVSDDGAKDAYRVMTELCHATRSPRFVSDRSGNEFAMKFTVTVSGEKKGQTKLTEDGKIDGGAKIAAIGSEGNYALGRHLSSDDYLDNATGFGIATPAPESVAYSGSKSTLGDAIDAYEDDGKHWRYEGPGDGSTDGYISPDSGDTVIDIAFPPQNSTHTTTAKESEETGASSDNHAPWKGFAPYFSFKASSDRTKDFNQPSTWMILNKSHKQFQTDSGSPAPWYQNFSWENGVDGVGNAQQKASLDTTIGGKRNSYLFEGVNVISRGMAYYHRPGDGNWKEHPNFFNPFWRARLAPVGQKLQMFWDRWVTQKIGTSSDSAVVQALVSVIKGFQMDLFTSFVTALITH